MIAFVQSARIQFLLGALNSEDGCQYRVKPGCVQPQTMGAEEPSCARGNPCLCQQPCFIQYKRPPLSPLTTGALWVCARIIAMQVAVQFGTLAQRELSSVSGGTAASPPLVVVEL